MKTILLILSLGSGLLMAGSPERAQFLMRQYDHSFLQWRRDVRMAPDNAAQNAAWLRKPDEVEAGRQVWEEIRGDLSQSWTLEPAAWLLREAAAYSTAVPPGRVRGGGLKSPAAVIREAVRKNHLRSSKLGPYCLALTHVQDPKAMSLLQLVEKVNPSEAVTGASALAQAILHRRLGGGKLIMAKRQEKLRKAILAPDLTVGRTTTQAILKDELFRMNRLNEGTVAPNFTGTEVTLKESELTDYRGKVTILFFWHSLMPTCDDSLALFRKYHQEFKGKEIEILGINVDNPLTLRRHIADGTVTWRNFSDPNQAITNLYRIETWPKVYVLDHEHKIQYRGEPGAFVKITALDLAKQAADRKGVGN